MADNRSLTSIPAQDAAIAAEAATKGDLSKLSPEQRTQLYGAVCKSMGLNPLSRPFEFITLNNKLTLYATRTATDQLRKINGVSITKVEKDIDEGVLSVTVYATDNTGRTDMEIGAVMIGGLRGEALANAHMKALTKAKRRVTLSISGLGWLDETEVGSVPSAQAVVVDPSTGEIDPGGRTYVASNSPIMESRNEEPDAVTADQALRGLHAVAKELWPDIDANTRHAMLHQWAVKTLKLESMAEVPGETLSGLAAMLKGSAIKASAFRSKYSPPEVIDAEAVEVEQAPQQYDLINDPELQAASDRVQKAERARA